MHFFIFCAFIALCFLCDQGIAADIQMNHGVEIAKFIDNNAVFYGEKSATLLKTSHSKIEIVWNINNLKSAKRLVCGVYNSVPALFLMGKDVQVLSLNDGALLDTLSPMNASPYEFFAGDLNGDGLTDLIGVDLNQLIVMLQEKEGIFSYKRVLLPTSEPIPQDSDRDGALRMKPDFRERKRSARTIWTEDLNNDGYQEILMRHHSRHASRLVVYSLRTNILQEIEQRNNDFKDFTTILNIDGHGDAEQLNAILHSPGSQGAVLPMVEFQFSKVDKNTGNLSTISLMSAFMPHLEYFPLRPEGGRGIILLSPRIGPTHRNELIRLVKDHEVWFKLVFGVLEPEGVKWLSTAELFAKLEGDGLQGMPSVRLHDSVWPPELIWPVEPGVVSICSMNGDCVRYLVPEDSLIIGSWRIFNQTRPVFLGPSQKEIIIPEHSIP